MMSEEYGTELQCRDDMRIAPILGRNARLPPLTNLPKSKRSEYEAQIIHPDFNRSMDKSAKVSMPKSYVKKQKDDDIALPLINRNSTFETMCQQSVRRKPLDIIVYFQNGSGLKLIVEDGENLTAGELFEMTLEEKYGLLKNKENISEKDIRDAREAFSLWLVSDLLELQMRPNHIPFQIAATWDKLLNKYTDADEDRVYKDEPILMFQRNVYYKRSQEREITNLQTIELLFYEAKENIIDGRYPLENVDQYHQLAVWYSLIKHKTYTQNTHNAEYFKSRLKDYYPEHLFKKSWSFREKKEPLEVVLARKLREEARKYNNDIQPKLSEFMNKYLTWCRDSLPYYGSAFFSGQIVHQRNKLLSKIFGQKEDPVYVAINTDGVFILDMDDELFLLGILYKDLLWELATKEVDNEIQCCLFLLFDYKEEKDEAEVKKLLQIFSKEAILMDKLILSNIESLKNSGKFNDGGDWLDDDDDFADGVIKAKTKIWEKFKECLTTFDKKGNCLANNAFS